MVTTPVRRPDAFVAFAVFPLILLAVGRVPSGMVLRMLLAASPFVLMVALFVPFTHPGREVLWQGPLGIRLTGEGLVQGAAIAVKSTLSLLATLALISTTRFADLVAGLERLGLPRVLGLILSFLYRYLFVLVDVAGRMLTARAARGFRMGPRQGIRSAGGLVGSLFLRTFERAERVHAAMIARGYDGQARSLRSYRLGVADGLFATLALAYMLSAAGWGWFA